MRKGLLPGLLSTMLAAGVLAGSNHLPVGFYKPNRANNLVVLLKSRYRYSGWHPIRVTVMVENQGMEPVLINGRMQFNQYPKPGEVSFIIEGPHGDYMPIRKAIDPGSLADDDIAVLRPGESVEREVDLRDMYGIRHSGPYRIQAIYYNGAYDERDGLTMWRGAIASEPTQITVQ
jgi:hypothetical protein